MSFLGFLLLGLIAGAIAKLIIPGRQGGGWLSLVLGVIGALLGGFLGGLIFHVGYSGFFSLSSWIIAIVGAIIVILIWQAITRRRTAA